MLEDECRLIGMILIDLDDPSNDFDEFLMKSSVLISSSDVKSVGEDEPLLDNDSLDRFRFILYLSNLIRLMIEYIPLLKLYVMSSTAN